MKHALIVVDYQRDFVAGSLGFAGAEALDEKICQKIAACRETGGDVLFTFDTHGADYMTTREGRHLPVEHCLRDSEGWRIYGRTSDLLEEAKCFYKSTFGSFELAEYLREQQYDSVELCGLVSNICVISNAVLALAALPEAAVTVDASATASGDSAMHEKALDIMAGLHIEITGR